MRRRRFIQGVTAFAAWPLMARAQQGESVRRIGVLMGPGESDPEAQSEITVFRQALRDRGWVGGHNVRIAYRWADGDVNRMQTFARELITLQPDAILAVTTPVVSALLNETRTVPIVFVRVSDPVPFVGNLAKPSGQRYWIQQFSAIASRKVGPTAQGDRAHYRACHFDVQSGNDAQ